MDVGAAADAGAEEVGGTGVGATAERGAGGSAAGALDGAAGVGEALLHASADMATSDPKMGATYRIFLILISPPPGLNLSSDKYWRPGTSLLSSSNLLGLSEVRCSGRDEVFLAWASGDYP